MGESNKDGEQNSKLIGVLASGECVYDRINSHIAQHPDVASLLPDALTNISMRGETRRGVYKK